MNDNRFSYLLILSMFLWGGGWSALKMLTNVPIEVVVFWRFFIMTLSFIPILYFLKKPLILNRSNVKYVAGSSALNIAFMIFSFLGIKYGMAGAAGVIITTLSPVTTFLLMAIIFRKRLANAQYFGLGVGMVGGFVMLQLNDLSLFLNGSNVYFLICALIWAGVTILSQRSHQHIHPIHYSFLISLVASVVSFIYGYDSNLASVFDQGSEFWMPLIYLGVLGQSVATTIFFMASGRLGSEKTSSYMFLVPVFALVIAWLTLNEPMQSHIVLGGLISVLVFYK